MINRNFGAKTRPEVERESILIARLTRNKFIDKNTDIYITDIQINYFYFFKFDINSFIVSKHLRVISK